MVDFVVDIIVKLFVKFVFYILREIVVVVLLLLEVGEAAGRSLLLASDPHEGAAAWTHVVQMAEGHVHHIRNSIELLETLVSELICTHLADVQVAKNIDVVRIHLVYLAGRTRFFVSFRLGMLKFGIQDMARYEKRVAFHVVFGRVRILRPLVHDNLSQLVRDCYYLASLLSFFFKEIWLAVGTFFYLGVEV